jgi:hypothetical protein
MKSPQSTYPLRLPRSVKAEVERRARTDCVSVNQFVATAVTEKLAVMGTAEFFAERRARADFTAFDRLMRRKGGEPPRPDDAIGWCRPAKILSVVRTRPPPPMNGMTDTNRASRWPSTSSFPRRRESIGASGTPVGHHGFPPSRE